MAKQLMIKPEKCTGCRTCELICSWNRGKDFNPQNSAVSVVDYEEEVMSIPMMCLQCEEAYCIKACKVGSLFRDGNGTVKNDTAKCIGCKVCVKACPTRSISFNQASKKILKCELCDGDPGCAKHCPPGCIVYTDEGDGLGRKRALALHLKNIFSATEPKAEEAAK